ncbi:hypothetical protein D9M68_761820 [compost metagenome]
MTNEQYIKRIAQMTESELLDEVMTSPEYITDSYFREFGDAIQSRHDELRNQRIEKTE